jgi:BNR/Asp-box repeat
VIDPTRSSTIYAATYDGNFRSDDGGATWNGLHRTPKSTNVLALAIDPVDPKTLYAATAFGVSKSLDAGLSWTLLNSDLFVTALSLDPRRRSVLYAGTHLGVLKSVDAGASWTPLHLGPIDSDRPPPSEDGSFP